MPTSTARLDYLEDSLGKRSGELRPILTSINGDNTWLLSFPRPASNKQPHKQYYHILTDPWLNGDTSFLSSWFIHISRSVPAVAGNGAEVDDIVKDLETAAAAVSGEERTFQTSSEKPLLDAIFINFHYLDHMHQPTLLTFNPKIPVFAAREAYHTIDSWGHFERVVMQNDYEPEMNGGWQSVHPGSPLPEWLTVFRLTGHKELNFATMIIWSHEGKYESILSSPHGIKSDRPSLQALFSDACEPPISILAMLAATKDSFAGGMQTTLGVSGSLAMERRLQPKYWVRTHDSTLTYGGAFMWLLWTNDRSRTLDDGLKEEAAAGKGDSRRPNLRNVESGFHLILE